jgi:hypothetical protein
MPAIQSPSYTDNKNPRMLPLLKLPASIPKHNCTRNCCDEWNMNRWMFKNKKKLTI